MSLLSLPPELLLKIFKYTTTSPIDPRDIVPLTLIHPSLTPIAHQFNFVDLSLSNRQIGPLLRSTAFQNHAALTQSLRFDVGEGEGIGTGGIGSEETINGTQVVELLQAIEKAFKKCKDAKVGGKARLTQLDVKKCRGMRSTILNGESLQNLKNLEIAAGFIFDNNDDDGDDETSTRMTFQFKLHSLTVANNHWESLPTRFLTALFSQTCQTSLETLNLSTLYSVDSFSPLLDNPTNLFSSITELYLPPFETFDQILFSSLLLDQSTSSSPLLYLELPNLSSPRENLMLLPFLESLSRNSSRFVEIGLKNYPGQALLDSLLIIFQCVFKGPPGTIQALEEQIDRGGVTKMERIRMVKILGGTAQVSRTMERQGELVVDLIGQFGCEVEYGEYKRN